MTQSALKRAALVALIAAAVAFGAQLGVSIDLDPERAADAILERPDHGAEAPPIPAPFE